MYINTNTSSLVARNAMRINDNDLSKAMERLSSGLRINTAADDAAGLAISERMNSQVRGMKQATRNAQDGVSLIQTAEGAMGTIADILQRMRELSVQADNDTYSATDKGSVKDEMTKLAKEIDHIATTTTFNGITLLGSTQSVTLHISDKFDDTLAVNLTDVQTAALGIDSIDVGTDAKAAIKAIDGALDKISKGRGELGANQNRLDFIVDNLQLSIQNTEASKSRISDADMAAESSSLTRAQILSQSSMAMLQKANQKPQSIMQLLQG
ncbi:flagellin N-terminal helical domain-containing protein [Bacillus sp. Brlt_9]|uniref:flagellin N-terminal helical domain-containing protein n=1 Tax=Bacillus sp. Brlt_9 TaxID=3110916 RepID=UPI003F7BAB4B